MRITKIALSMFLCFLLLIMNNIILARGAMDFVYPLPEIPQELVYGERAQIDYGITTKKGWAVSGIISNYDDPKGDIVSMKTCSNLPFESSCIFSLEVIPKSKADLSLNLWLFGSEYTAIIREPRTSTIKVVPVRITKDPTSAIVKTGGETMFIVGAKGGPEPLKYQWKLNGRDISQETKSIYTIKNASKEYDAGKYTVEVSANDGSGKVTSKEATLQVGDGPVINTQPNSQIIVTNNPVTFSVEATGLGDITYQWIKDDIEISSATNKSYTIQKAAKEDAGNYQVKVTDGTKVTVNSAKASLKVGDIPTVITQPKSQAIVVGNQVTFTVVAGGTGPFTYQWKKDGVPITGATSDTYSISSVKYADVGKYAVSLTSDYGNILSNDADLKVGDAPTIVTQPKDKQSIAVGNQATFKVVASGTGPLAYQWKKDGTPIKDATSDTYNISSVKYADAGKYTVSLTSDYGSITSNDANLKVGDVPSEAVIQPASVTVAVGQSTQFKVTTKGTPPFAYQWKMNGTDISGATSDAYSATATSGPKVKYTVKVSNEYTSGSITSNEATLSPLAITSITPTRGPAAGTTQVTINGYGFDGSDSTTIKNTRVVFNGVEYTPSPVTSTTATFTVLQDLTISNGKQDKDVQIKVDNVITSSPTKFTYYDPFLRSVSDDPSIKNLSVNSLAYDYPNKILYIAADGGVYSYNTSSSPSAPTLIGFKDALPKAVVFYGDKLYVGLNKTAQPNSGGIYQYDFSQKTWNSISPQFLDITPALKYCYSH